MNNDKYLKQQLAELLQKSFAHADFDEAIKDLDIKSSGIQLPHLPYTIWQLVEHLRIAQQDILNFSVNPNYQVINWPDDYWAIETAPADEQQWENALQGIKISLADFTALINQEETDLIEPLAMATVKIYFGKPF